MISLFGYVPFFGFWFLALLVGGALADIFSGWGGGNR